MQRNKRELFVMHENEISEKIIGAAIEVHHKGIKAGTDLRLDLFVEDKVIIDLKLKETVSSINKSKILRYLRLSDKHLGLIINFHVDLLRDGIERVVNALQE